jgi:hypothetical protein
VLAEQSKEVGCPRLADAKLHLYVPDRENRVGDEQVHDFGGTASAATEARPIGLGFTEAPYNFRGGKL